MVVTLFFMRPRQGHIMGGPIQHRGIRWERPCPMDIVLVGAPIDRAEALPYVIVPFQGIDAPNGGV